MNFSEDLTPTSSYSFGNDFDSRKNYLWSYLNAFREKMTCVTVQGEINLDRELRNINSQYEQKEQWPERFYSGILLKSDLKKPFETLSEWRQEKQRDNEYQTYRAYSDSEPFKALHLLDEVIYFSLQPERGISAKYLPEYLRLMGRILIKCGMIEQGLPYMLFGCDNSECGIVHKDIGDDRNAVKYFAMALAEEELNNADRVCQEMAISYFRLGQYEKALEVIEEILPAQMAPKKAFEGSCKSQTFATAMMLAIQRHHDLSGKKFDFVKIRIKYPLTSKYLIKCFGQISSGLEAVERIETETEEFEKFRNEIKPRQYIYDSLSEDYREDEFNDLFYQLAGESWQKTALYHK